MPGVKNTLRETDAEIDDVTIATAFNALNVREKMRGKSIGVWPIGSRNGVGTLVVGLWWSRGIVKGT